MSRSNGLDWSVENYLFNGNTSDLERNNTQGTLLASAARTATTTSPIQTNYNAKGIALFLTVPAASGTGGLQPVIQAQDPVTGNWVTLTALPTAITASTLSGAVMYLYYPGITQATNYAGGVGVQQVVSTLLPRTFRAAVYHGDSSSYTYALGYALIL